MEISYLAKIWERFGGERQKLFLVVEGSEASCQLTKEGRDRLFEVAVDKNKTLAEMIGEEGGSKMVKWRWRRRLFHWEEEMLEACQGLVLEAVNLADRDDCWKWGKLISI
ncbi:hypothetical protein A2U01_0030617 [Trifolium medium]|uniref:Uncharacterized protein n=1 Tax=Trifolium medium TaxID=97028 RepID=A0A392PBK9_9FABA|nr:hypothetical protein [Trifolium medium]